jgi:hypothetical protein
MLDRATALRLGTAQPQDILRRFARTSSRFLTASARWLHSDSRCPRARKGARHRDTRDAVCGRFENGVVTPVQVLELRGGQGLHSVQACAGGEGVGLAQQRDHVLGPARLAGDGLGQGLRQAQVVWILEGVQAPIALVGGPMVIYQDAGERRISSSMTCRRSDRTSAAVAAKPRPQSHSPLSCTITRSSGCSASAQVATVWSFCPPGLRPRLALQAGRRLLGGRIRGRRLVGVVALLVQTGFQLGDPLLQLLDQGPKRGVLRGHRVAGSARDRPAALW